MSLGGYDSPLGKGYPAMDIHELFELGFKRELPKVKGAPMGIRINIGAGKQVIPGVENLDYPEWDAEKDFLPYKDNSVSTIHAYHILEHISNIIPLLRECQRVLKSGGVMNIVVPYYNSQLMAEDLDHKTSFTEETWDTLFKNDYYFKDKEGWRFVTGVNLICGLKERNLCLMTQLIKR